MSPFSAQITTLLSERNRINREIDALFKTQKAWYVAKEQAGDTESLETLRSTFRKLQVSVNRKANMGLVGRPPELEWLAERLGRGQLKKGIASLRAL